MTKTYVFAPKITYRMAAMSLGQRKPTTPWEYLANWSQSDRGPDETLYKLNDRMQERWPGKYRIVEKEIRSKEHMYRLITYDFEFDNPADETFFKLKYS
jgi:hypothetical protein